MSYIDDSVDQWASTGPAPRRTVKASKPSRDLSVVPRPDVVVGSGLIDLRGAPSSMEEQAKRCGGK